jgi:hypothetical protein
VYLGYKPGTYLTERTGMEIQSLPVAALHVARTTLAQPLSFSDLYSTLCAEREIISAKREGQNAACLCGGSMREKPGPEGPCSLR